VIVVNKGGKENILDAARTVIARSGVNNASMQAIAEEAGLSKGALYYHYKSKDDILYALIDQFLREALEPVKISLNKNGDHEQLKSALISGICRRLENMDHNRLQFYLTHEAVLGHESMNDLLGRKYNGWVDTAEEVMNRLYDIPASRLNRAFAATLIAAIDGQVIQLLLKSGVVSLDELHDFWTLLVDVGIPGLLRHMQKTESAEEAR
jgi:AcrR family transcriptional regulator